MRFAKFYTDAPINKNNSASCSECGCPGRTKDTRPMKLHGFVTIRRTRYCIECKNEWMTYEIREEWLARKIETIRKINSVRSVLIDAVAAINRSQD